jgi:hypothetical protein
VHSEIQTPAPLKGEGCCSNARQLMQICYKNVIFMLRFLFGGSVFQVLRKVSAYILSETKSWGSLLAFVASFFILATAITNALYGLFDFKLLSVFENTLAHVRLFIHELFEMLLYRPIAWIGSLIASWALPDLELPNLRPPQWYVDIVLISMILSRAERSAMRMSSPVAHAPDDDGAYSRLENASWLLVLFFYVPSKALLSPLKMWAPKRIHDSARVFLDGVTWLGIWFLLHDIMVVRTNWKSERERDVSHRAFVTYLVLSLLAALAAVALFFVANGYLHDKFLNEPTSG